MKRILKLFLITASVLCALFLASCGESASAPKDMKLARGGEEYGYNFYVPDAWVVSNYGDFACAYVSAVNTTSVTFGEAEMPSEGLDTDGFTQDEVKAYFHARMANLAYSDTMKIITDGVKSPFGNEQNAYKFDFTYDFARESGDAIKYRSLQYLIVRGERLYIFQYNSQNTAPNYSTDGKTYFDIYIENSEKTVTASDVITQFRFLDKPGTSEKSEAGCKGELVAVSDKSISGFDFYAPSDSKAIASSALVHRDLGNGGSVAVSEFVSNYQTAHPDDYWIGIKSNMEKAYGTVTDINPTTEENKNENKIDITGALWGFYYEYTYTYAGVEYRGYTVLIRVDKTLKSKAYMYTYTAKADDFDSELSEKMLERLAF